MTVDHEVVCNCSVCTKSLTVCGVELVTVVVDDEWVGVGVVGRPIFTSGVVGQVDRFDRFATRERESSVPDKIIGFPTTVDSRAKAIPLCSFVFIHRREGG